MKRTTISLPDELARTLEREARRRGASVSSIAREAIAERLRVGTGTQRSLPFVGLGRSGENDTAQRAEEILSEEWRPDRDR